MTDVAVAACDHQPLSSPTHPFPSPTESTSLVPRLPWGIGFELKLERVGLEPQTEKRNNPSMPGPSIKALPATWQIYENPLFDDGEVAHGDQLKAEVEKERQLREKAEEQRAFAARDAAEERRRREAAESKLKELERELKRAHHEKMRLRSPTENSKAPGKDERKQSNQLLRERSGAEQRRRSVPEKMVKEVENPHIRRGIVGFVEFPRMMRNRTRSSGGNAGPCSNNWEGRTGSGGGTAPSLECQKAQLRVLLKNNRVSAVGAKVRV